MGKLKEHSRWKFWEMPVNILCIFDGCYMENKVLILGFGTNKVLSLALRLISTPQTRPGPFMLWKQPITVCFWALLKNPVYYAQTYAPKSRFCLKTDCFIRVYYSCVRVNDCSIFLWSVQWNSNNLHWFSFHCSNFGTHIAHLIKFLKIIIFYWHNWYKPVSSTWLKWRI